MKLFLMSLLLCFSVFAFHKTAAPAYARNVEPAASGLPRTVTAPVIIDKPVRLTELREKLMREYAVKHYGEAMTEIVPQAVVVHWTASPDRESVYRYFYKENRSDGTLNMCSQFLVDRDGTVFRLTPETMLDRHAIGYNWCAIGIENVGGACNKEDLTAAQLQANLALIRYLKEKYPAIQYVWGHYQQVEARESGLYKEAVEGYFNPKVDPGPKFMRALQQKLKDTGLLFYKP